ncbi:hypothetical protein [Streptomyces sp. CAU 1734]|uniref:hypothetical protein n=1 Tax=Streptomyces sp. CAU 1734 TaxID=3140360 RepID=UPI003260130D
MFEFGVAGYEPEWLSGGNDIARRHGGRLRALAGRVLTRVWLVWDVRGGEWFRDGPVLFDFAGEQVEIVHRAFDDISLSWNTIDPGRPVHWPDFDLEWRPEPLAELRPLPGRRLTEAGLLEWTGTDAARGSVSVSFVLAGDRVTVFNALDENGLHFGPPHPLERPHGLG